MDLNVWGNGVNAFFQTAFGSTPGYICIALLPVGKRDLKERYFEWPRQRKEILQLVYEKRDDHDVYFCPNLFGDPKFKRESDGKGPRVKENVKTCPTAWADLDTCNPNTILPRPSIFTETSPGRFQALWRLDGLPPLIAEAISKRIAYGYADNGADRSGWDLTQLLRVPGTFNHKYPHALTIETKGQNRGVYREVDFAHIPLVTDIADTQIDFPEALPEENALELLAKHKKRLNSLVHGLFANEPLEGEYKEGWSGALWKLIMLLFEAGMNREEVFIVTKDAKCNKYIRDNRTDGELWKDVTRGYFKHQQDLQTTIIPELIHVELLTEEEVAGAQGRRTFVDRYIEWASGLGDAAVQYHQAGAFVILSALLAGKVVLPTSFGNIVPNLWFMILGDTTLSRKSTTMDIAMDLLLEVDPDAIMATDGSIEGLLTGISMRPGRPSIFLRDEFSGLIEAMTKKDYMAGMAETLTKLYDGKYSKRVLRRESVEIREPILILYAGGIRDRVQQLLTFDQVASGFMPRFVFITAEPDVSKIKPMGPPIVRDMSARQALLDEMQEIFLHYNQVKSGIRLGAPPKIHTELSVNAWDRFNAFESEMMRVGVESERPDLLTPVFDRLGKSTLKVAMLLAASEQREDKVTVEEEHIVNAIVFADKWREYSVEVINGVGKSSYERDLEKVLSMIKRRPGVSRSQLMQSFHLTAQTASNLFATLEQRNLVTTNNYGRANCYWPVGYKEPEGEEKDDGGKAPLG